MNTSIKLPQLIGLAGTFASGKDTLARVLADEHGFNHVSTGDMVREIAMAKFGNIERPTLHQTAEDLRKKQGGGALVIEAAKKPRPLIITGIRSLGEAKEIKKAGGVMIYVDAEPQIRYQRMRARRRDDETELTLEEFLAGEAKEMNGGSTDADFNIRAIGEMADARIDNSGTPAEFIAAALAKIKKFAN